MYKKILFTDDLSQQAIKPLSAAVDLAKKYKAELVILNVRGDFLSKEEMVMLRIDVSKFQNDLKSEALAIRSIIESDLESCGGADLKPDIIIREGAKVAHTICEVAEEVGADLIVIGSHGTSMLKDKLFGSTSQHIIRHTKRSILVVWTKE